MSKEIAQAVAEYRERLDKGLPKDDMIAELDDRGFSLVDIVKVVKQACRVSLGEAHRLVRTHPRWHGRLAIVRRFTVGVSTTAPVADIAAMMASAYGLAFQERVSLYYGGQYFIARTQAEEIRIYPNFDLIDREPAYAHVADCSVLIDFAGMERDPALIMHEVAAILGCPCRVVSPRGFEGETTSSSSEEEAGGAAPSPSRGG